MLKTSSPQKKKPPTRHYKLLALILVEIAARDLLSRLDALPPWTDLDPAYPEIAHLRSALSALEPNTNLVQLPSSTAHS